MARTDFERRLRTATGFMSPRVLSGAALSADDVAQLAKSDRYALWLTPSTVEDYEPADFVDLPESERTRLDDAIRQFRAAVSATPPDAPPTGEQYRDGLTALGRLAAAADPVIRVGQYRDVGRCVERAMREPQVGLDGVALSYDYNLVMDSTGEPAALIWVMVPDNVDVTTRDFQHRLSMLRRALRQEFADWNIARWPYVRVRSIRETQEELAAVAGK